MSESSGDSSRSVASAEGVAEPLGRWLETHLPGNPAVKVTDLKRPKGGFSAETWLVDAEVGGEGRRFVLRREVPGPAVYPVQVPGLDVEVDIQYRVMAALTRAGTLPLAPLVAYEADLAVLSQPFFVMEFVGGQVPGESPPYPGDGFFTELAPAERTAMVKAGLGVVAAAHQVDWRKVGLDFLVAPGDEPGLATQVARWEAYGERELAGRDHPVLADGLRWLHERTPAHRPPAFAWGDPRPGNIIWDGVRPVCLTDFEAASIAPPEMDLGWWLMFDWTMHEGAKLERPAGDPTRDEQVDLYATAAGADVGDVRWFEIFAAARYCMIVARVMNRAVAAGMMPADNTVWRDNPASVCLAALLDG